MKKIYRTQKKIHFTNSGITLCGREVNRGDWWELTSREMIERDRDLICSVCLSKTTFEKFAETAAAAGARIVAEDERRRAEMTAAREKTERRDAIAEKVLAAFDQWATAQADPGSESIVFHSQLRRAAEVDVKINGESFTLKLTVDRSRRLE